MNDIKIHKIIRSKRKTIALVVTPDATLIVRAPFGITLNYIKNLVFQKRFWITVKMKAASKGGLIGRSKEFVNGEGFLYLGKTYKLKIQDCEQIKLSDCLVFPKNHLDDSQGNMIKWYKEKALEKLRERANWYCNHTGWKFKTIKITNAERRWGSCGPSGSINFTWKLIMAPLNVIDYVVVHELAHTQERNHSIKFWNKVRTVLPDYKQREVWLRENGKFLSL